MEVMKPKPMPEVLADWLQSLDVVEGGIVAEWLDETPNPQVEMISAINRSHSVPICE